ncbi:peroxidase P7-like [Pyrus x bretschneideri]|uniref:peroxidase P7-like n=1 Tax=Pyrus x bretschneideri TaxID=225117 RepID=UPI0005109504|nr:peroxidase P7-like [Pyrus x bretschneideri]
MAILRSFLAIICIVLVAATSMKPTSAKLNTHYYTKGCPQALPAIRKAVERAIKREPRMGASLVRLHFHDCFVNGCDGSVLLDDTSNFTGEKTALPNVNSIRGLNVVDDIKKAVDKACKKSVVSCADILAVAARDSVSILGGPTYKVQLGRRDARTASVNDANRNLPPPFFNFPQLLSNFEAHGLNLKDLVVLSAAHTLGLARCTTFRARIYNDTNIDPKFAALAKKNCPTSGGDDNTRPLDATSKRFDTVYFEALLKSKGLLHSDQELFKGNGSDSDKLVQRYSKNSAAFGKDFANSMIKMGNIKPLTGNEGEVRLDCRKIN